MTAAAYVVKRVERSEGWGMNEYFLLAVGVVLPYVTLISFGVALAYNFFKWLLLPRPIMWAIFPAKKSLLSVLLTVGKRIFTLPGPRKFDITIFSLAWMFHIGLIISLSLHAKYILVPHLPFEYELGVAAGLSAAIGSFGFLLRRLADDRRAESHFADYFALVLLIVTLTLGLYIRAFELVDSSELFAWVQGILTLKPVLPPDNILFLIHIIFAQVYMIYLPFKTLIHPIAILYGQKVILDKRHIWG